MQSPKERDARLQQVITAREQTIATESTEERQTRLQQHARIERRCQVREAPSPTERCVRFFLSGEETRQN